ncbi:MAG: hypothetical protein ACRD2C_16815 [Acidimicrobiales bacterium]
MPDPDAMTSAGDRSEDGVERDELERLRQEAADLRQAQAVPGSGSGPARRRGWRFAGGARWTAVAVLAVLLVLLTPVTLLARYAHSELLDTDRYVSTVAPLARDPAVQDQVAADVTREVFRHLDIENVTRDTLQRLADSGAPSAVVDLATPIAAQVEEFARSEVRTLVATERFATLWAEANRVAHSELRALLTGDEGALQAEDDRVTLELDPVVAAVRQRLIDRGFGLASNIPGVTTELTLVESDGLTRAQTVTRRLNTAATVLPFVVLVLVVAAVLLAPNRRRGLLTAAVAVVLGALVLGVALAVARGWFVDDLTSDSLSTEAATSIADALLGPLRTSLRAALVAGLIVAAACLGGPAALAVARRRGATRGATGVRQGATAGSPPSAAEAWVGAHKPALRVGVVAAAAFALAFWSDPTAGVVLVLAGLTLLGLAIVELLAAGVTPLAPEPAQEPTSGSTDGRS